MGIYGDIKAWVETTLKETGWTAKEWASRAGVSRSTVNRFKSDNITSSMTIETYVKLRSAVARDAPYVKARLSFFDVDINPLDWMTTYLAVTRAIDEKGGHLPPKTIVEIIESVRENFTDATNPPDAEALAETARFIVSHELRKVIDNKK